MTAQNFEALYSEKWQAGLERSLPDLLVAEQIATTNLSELIGGASSIVTQRFEQGFTTTHRDGQSVHKQTREGAEVRLQAKYIVDYGFGLTREQEALYFNSPAYLADTMKDARDRLKKEFDARTLLQIKSATNKFDQGNLINGVSSGVPLALTQLNVDNTILGAFVPLESVGVDTAKSYLVVAPQHVTPISQWVVGAGFNRADQVLENGYKGSPLGHDLYVSTNLPHEIKLKYTDVPAATETITLNSVELTAVSTVTAEKQFKIVTGDATATYKNLIDLINTISAPIINLELSDITAATARGENGVGGDYWTPQGRDKPQGTDPVVVNTSERELSVLRDYTVAQDEATGVLTFTHKGGRLSLAKTLANATHGVNADIDDSHQMTLCHFGQKKEIQFMLFGGLASDSHDLPGHVKYREYLTTSMINAGTLARANDKLVELRLYTNNMAII